MGGRVGLKGTDGDAYRRALELGAEPWAPRRAVKFLMALPRHVKVIVPNGIMGELEAKEAGATYEVVRCAPEGPTSADDTVRCAREIALRVPLLAFVGGDGTARDLLSAVGDSVPLLGVPAGVKMYSALFAQTPSAAGRVVEDYLAGRLGLRKVEVLDIDEEAFRAGRLSVRLYGHALAPHSPDVIVEGKEVIPQEPEELRSIAKYIVDNISDDELYVLGPGTTVAAIAEELGLPKTLLGIDAVTKRSVVGLDLAERQLLELAEMWRGRVRIVVSPLGGQGFIIGRGNQQLSPRVIKAVGPENLIVVATKAKLRSLRALRVDTGDEELDARLRGFRRVVVGYGEEMVMRVV